MKKHPLFNPLPQETDQDSSPEPKLDVFFDPIPSDGFEDYTTRYHSNENRDFKHQFTVSCCSSVYAGSSDSVTNLCRHLHTLLALLAYFAYYVDAFDNLVHCCR